MPGMGGSAAGGASLPALAVVLALFMVGYVVWAADQLTSLARSSPAGRPRGTSDPAPYPAFSAALAGSGSEGSAGTQVTSNAVRAAQPQPAAGSMLAPRLAACSKIAMGLVMGYMLILML